MKMEVGAKPNPWKGGWEPLVLVYRTRLQRRMVGNWKQRPFTVGAQEDLREPDYELSGVLQAQLQYYHLSYFSPRGVLLQFSVSPTFSQLLGSLSTD